jgi:hypothetical protein
LPENLQKSYGIGSAYDDKRHRQGDMGGFVTEQPRSGQP